MPRLRQICASGSGLGSLSLFAYCLHGPVWRFCFLFWFPGWSSDPQDCSNTSSVSWVTWPDRLRDSIYCEINPRGQASVVCYRSHSGCSAGVLCPPHSLLTSAPSPSPLHRRTNQGLGKAQAFATNLLTIEIESNLGLVLSEATT